MISAISIQEIEAFQRDGAVCLRDLFKDWTEPLKGGIETNMADPGPYAAKNLKQGEKGRFFDDYCNWTRIPEFSDFVHTSPAAEVAALLMQTPRVQMFHDHVLVKEPGTSKPTPWHQDAPYYFADGDRPSASGCPSTRRPPSCTASGTKPSFHRAPLIPDRLPRTCCASDRNPAIAHHPNLEPLRRPRSP